MNTRQLNPSVSVITDTDNNTDTSVINEKTYTDKEIENMCKNVIRITRSSNKLKFPVELRDT